MTERVPSSPDSIIDKVRRHWELLVGAGALAGLAIGAAKTLHERKLEYEDRLQRALDRHDGTYELFDLHRTSQSAAAKTLMKAAAISLTHTEGITLHELKQQLGRGRWVIDGKPAVQTLRDASVIQMAADDHGRTVVQPTPEFAAVILQEHERWSPLFDASREVDDSFRLRDLADFLLPSEYHDPLP